MLSINTNLSSLIAQNSLKDSTSILNQAVERMTTGYKINHAKDNAANYSISTNMQTQIHSYDVASDNVAMGMDLVTTASDIISTMQSHANRLQSLSIQARNGTYGAQSMQAINSEASAIISEINRLYNTAEYNGISLFDRTEYTIAPHLPQAGESGFIDETTLSATGPPEARAEYNGFIADPTSYEASYVDGLTSVSAAIEAGTLVANGEYKLSDVKDLKALAKFVNDGNVTTNMTFIMSDDIDLKNESNWTPIGDRSVNATAIFTGIFNGNGHSIKNLVIDKSSVSNIGLFGIIGSGSKIKNVRLVEASVKGLTLVGALVGNCQGTIENSYVQDAFVSGQYQVGVLVGRASGNTAFSNSYTSGYVEATQGETGGLIGYISGNCSILNCSSTAGINGMGKIGGLVGYFVATSGNITNCFATGNVISSAEYAGGLVGFTTMDIINCYATGSVSSTKSSVGGLCGRSRKVINSYATGNVEATGMSVGGLIGLATASVINCYATGNVRGADTHNGGLIGYLVLSSNIATIENSYSTGCIDGKSFTGGLIGSINNTDTLLTIKIKDCKSYSTIISSDNTSTGSFIGCVTNTNDSGVTYSTVDIVDCSTIINDYDLIGRAAKFLNGGFHNNPNYDKTTWYTGIEILEPADLVTHLQVGINSNSSSRIDFDTTFQYDISSLEGNIASDESYAMINDFLTMLSEKSTMLGAVENRLQSAVDSIEVNIENLTSSLSTIRDADIAEVSSTYIQQQILQQAASTLFATANQSPSIVLQLI